MLILSTKQGGNKFETGASILSLQRQFWTKEAFWTKSFKGEINL